MSQRIKIAEYKIQYNIKCYQHKTNITSANSKEQLAFCRTSLIKTYVLKFKRTCFFSMV